VRFLIDMPVSPRLVPWLLDRGHDAVHAVELGLSSATDDRILDWARKDQRIIITADLDYPRILALSGAEGPGLMLFRGGNYSEAETVDRLAKALESVPDDRFQSSIVVIEKTRIRRRALPI
jgi:predicted nuclease of predicted toxin-antitoxin system